MYKKLFIYSKEERKFHHIPGIVFELLLCSGMIPLTGLFIALWNYFVDILKGSELTLVICVGMFSMLGIALWRVIVYLKESLTVYGVEENGTIRILNMTRNAASYLSLQTTMMNNQMSQSGVGGKKLAMMKSAASVGKMLYSSMEEMEDNEDVQKSTTAGRQVYGITEVISKKKCFIVKGNFSGKKSIRIRRVYEEQQDLEKYFKYIAEGNKAAEYEFHKRTKLEDFVKPGQGRTFIRRSLYWCGIVAWCAAFTFSTDLNTMARIKHKEYVEANAVVESVFQDEKTGKWENVLHYTANKKDVERSFQTKKKTFQNNDSIKIYYAKNEPSQFLREDEIGFHLQPYGVMCLFGEAIVLIFGLSFKKR